MPSSSVEAVRDSGNCVSEEMPSHELFEFNGKEDGPTSIILVGVHGNETCGVEALKKILPSLQIERGRVFIGYGNPHAIQQNVRSTEANLNRMFKPDDMLSESEKASYEYGRAQFLKQYLEQADALLDVHSSNIPQSRPFIICEPNASEITGCLPFDLVVFGFDAVEPGGTDYYMNSIGKIGICTECGYTSDPASVLVAEESIMAFLGTQGHVVKDVKTYEQSFITMNRIYLTKTDNFVLARPFADFEDVPKETVIGTDGGEEVKASEDGVILFAEDGNKIGDEGFLFGPYGKKIT
jgi:predicted deacylase